MKKTLFPTPTDAEAAFYRAFETADLEAMMVVWNKADNVECIHPMGERLHGIEAIKKGWQAIFLNTPEVKFSISGQFYIKEKNLAVHVVNENILVADAHEQPSLMVATNIYENTADGWRMVLHHASPAPRSAQTNPGQASSVVH
jgi:ketosteroid isomerase-like protein